MSIKILRSALLGAAVAALVIAPAIAVDQGFAPRPDFPGAKQGETHHHYHQHLHHYRSSLPHGRFHHAG
jgi:hypothetical protein